MTVKWKFGEPAPLTEGWPHNYTSAMKHIGGTHKDSSAAKAQIRWLKQLSKQLYVKGRGEAFIPVPQADGYYPSYRSIPYNTLRTATRKNTSARMRRRAWATIQRSGEEFKPPPVLSKRHSGLSSMQKAKLMQHIELALPHERGKEPRYLGKRVPGQKGRVRASIIDWSEIDPDDVKIGQGFSKAKYSKTIIDQYVSAGIKPPKGKGIHRPTFHRLAIKLMSQGMERNAAYATAMKQLGRNKAVNIGHRKSSYDYHNDPAYQYGLKEGWRKLKWKAKQTIKSIFPPELKEAAIKGALKSGLESLDRQFGSGSGIEINGVPIRQRGFLSDFQTLSNTRLKGLREKLVRELTSVTTEAERKAIEKRLSKIIEERFMRNLL